MVVVVDEASDDVHFVGRQILQGVRRIARQVNDLVLPEIIQVTIFFPVDLRDKICDRWRARIRSRSNNLKIYSNLVSLPPILTNTLQLKDSNSYSTTSLYIYL